jgi:hypothetical protein
MVPAEVKPEGRADRPRGLFVLEMKVRAMKARDMAKDAHIATSCSWRSRARAALQVKWIVTVAGAIAMAIIAAMLLWNVFTAPNPLAQLVPGFAQTAEHQAER